MNIDQIKAEVLMKLESVQNEIDILERKKSSFAYEAVKLKSEIKEAVEHHVNGLRKREQLLLRQVEVVSTQQNSLLTAHQGELLHVEGGLEVMKEVLDTCSDQLPPAVANIELTVPSMQNSRLLKSIVVQLDSRELSSAVSGFGQVHLPDQITQHSSPLLPEKSEEYGDQDSDLCYKSVAANNPNNIVVRFPSIKKNVQPTVNQTQVESNKKDISAWVRSLKVTEDDEFSVGSSDMMKDFAVIGCDSVPDTPKTSFTSDSIEIISRFSSDKGWSCNGDVCDIENLGSISDKSRWLKTPIINVKTACCANEPCESFEDCVCNGACESAAMDKAKQISRSKAMRDLKKSSQKPVASTNDHNIWLKNTSPATKRSANSDILSDLLAIKNTPMTQWLRTTENLEPKAKMAKTETGPVRKDHFLADLIALRSKPVSYWLKNSIIEEKPRGTTTFSKSLWLKSNKTDSLDTKKSKKDVLKAKNLPLSSSQYSNWLKKSTKISEKMETEENIKDVETNVDFHEESNSVSWDNNPLYRKNEQRNESDNSIIIDNKLTKTDQLSSLLNSPTVNSSNKNSKWLKNAQNIKTVTSDVSQTKIHPNKSLWLKSPKSGETLQNKSIDSKSMQNEYWLKSDNCTKDITAHFNKLNMSSPLDVTKEKLSMLYLDNSIPWNIQKA